MKTITFEQMYAILEECSAVVWDMHFLSYPAYWMPGNGDGDGQFLHLEGKEGFDEYEVNFKEKDNEVVKVVGKRFILKDYKGNDVEIRPLFDKDLEK